MATWRHKEKKLRFIDLYGRSQINSVFGATQYRCKQMRQHYDFKSNTSDHGNN